MPHNTRRMNRLEELGRVDAERAFSRRGRRNLRDEKRRIVSGLRGGGIAKRGKGIAIGIGCGLVIGSMIAKSKANGSEQAEEDENSTS